MVEGEGRNGMSELAHPLPEAPSPVRPVVWPAVIGVLAIVSGINVVAGASWIGDIVALPEIFDKLAMGAGSPLEASVVIALRLLALGCAATGIVGGALMMRRRPIGRTLLLVYAIVRLLHLLARPLDQGATYDLAFGPPEIAELGLWTGIGELLAGAPFCIVLLVWLCRKRVRRQVRAMRDPVRREAMRPAAGSVWPIALGLLTLMGEITPIVGILLCPFYRPLLMLGVRVDPVFFAFDMPSEHYAWLLLRMALGTGASFFSGIVLLTRRWWARTLVPMWAILSIVLLVSAHTVLLRDKRYVAEEEKLLFYSLYVGYGLLHLILPVFVLIWTLLPSFREQMAGWRRKE